MIACKRDWMLCSRAKLMMRAERFSDSVFIVRKVRRTVHPSGLRVADGVQLSYKPSLYIQHINITCGYTKVAYMLADAIRTKLV